MAKKATRSSILADYKYMGRDEPSIENMNTVNMVRAYSWYTHFKDTDDAKSYITEYCKVNKIKHIKISKHKNNTYGWLARMLSRGAVVSDETKQKFNSYIASLQDKTKDEVVNTETTNKQSNKMELYLPDVEEAIDKFNEPFNMYQHITANNIPQIYVKQIIEYYEPIQQEIQDAYDKKDKELIEAYSCYRRTDLKNLIKRINDIIDDCQRFLGNVKKERKPRKKRTRSVESILKHFKYMESHDELKIVSENPQKILGSSAVYVLNTKNNILSMFIAKDDSGLTVSRTAIDNYDEAKSKCKKVGRNVTSAIDSIINGTKRSRVKVLDSIKTKESNFTPRLSDNHIILKVDK